jgi:hypothetical protein
MADIESVYKKSDGRILIEIKLSSPVQLFNSFDPAPFHEKEIDTAAEKYIVDTIKDFPKNTQFRIVVYLPQDLVQTEQAKTIGPAIHNHFKYQEMVSDRKFRQKLKYGRTVLVIGLAFLFLNLFIRQILLNTSDSTINLLVAEALLIIGWVAMWEPITVLLYELWPIIQIKKLYSTIATMEIDVLPYSR